MTLQSVYATCLSSVRDEMKEAHIRRDEMKNVEPCIIPSVVHEVNIKIMS